MFILYQLLTTSVKYLFSSKFFVFFSRVYVKQTIAEHFFNFFGTSLSLEPKMPKARCGDLLSFL
jgi:hypothetical protein